MRSSPLLIGNAPTKFYFIVSSVDKFSVVNASSDDSDDLLPLLRRGSTYTLSSLMYPRRRLTRSPHGVVPPRELSSQVGNFGPIRALQSSTHN